MENLTRRTGLEEGEAGLFLALGPVSAWYRFPLKHSYFNICPPDLHFPQFWRSGRCPVDIPIDELLTTATLCSNSGVWRRPPKMELLIVLLVLLLITTPILAILAITRTQQISEQMRALRPQDLVARLYSIEQRIAAIEKALHTGPDAETHPTPVAEGVPTPEATPEAPISLVPTPSEPPTPSAETIQQVPKPAEVAAFAGGPSQTIGVPIPAPGFGQQKTGSPLDLEHLIAGRWFNRIGILALIVTVSLFLKYAFDNNWIGPSGRVGIGILLGAAMLPWSQWLLGRGYSYFSEGIAALGQATLLLSIWAGCRYYTLFTREVGFSGMILITAVMAAVALGRNSERIALLSLLGGFLTPLLVSTGKDEQIVLFTYLLILGAGLLVMAALRDWHSLGPISFVLTQLYFWGWYESFYRPPKLERTIIFATLFFLLFLVIPVLRAIRFSELDAIAISSVLANSFAYLAALYALLWPQDRWTLTFLVLALGAAHLTIVQLTPSPERGRSPLTRQLFAGLALTFATLAIPIRLEGKWITLGFAVEGAILIWSGYRSLASLLRYAGFFLLIVAAFRVVFLPGPVPTFLFNERFATYMAVIACMGVALFAARQHSAAIGEREKDALGVLAVAINVYALIALSLELWDYFGRVSSLGVDTGLAQHLALSLLWSGYACVLILLGIKERTPLLRWQALILFGLVVIKVFLYDSSYLARFYRIISFFVLGLVLLVVSFLYQTKASRERSSS